MKKLLTILTLVFVFTSLASAGIEWTSKIITEGKKKGQNNRVIAHIYAQGGDLKQVFDEVSNANPFYTQQGYWLFKSKEDNIYVVDDVEKSYMELNLDSLLQLTGFLGQLVKIRILDHSIDSEMLGKEQIAGYTCNHMKITTDYTMKMKILIIKKTIKVHEVKEIWAVPNFKGLKEINDSFLKKDYKTGIADLDQLIKEQQEQQQKIGFPLKIETHTLQLSKKKSKVISETSTTMEVTGIKTEIEIW